MALSRLSCAERTNVLVNFSLNWLSVARVRRAEMETDGDVEWRGEGASGGGAKRFCQGVGFRGRDAARIGSASQIMIDICDLQFYDIELII
jgi:hypothetical protein